jgi:hypothetical protein
MRKDLAGGGARAGFRVCAAFAVVGAATVPLAVRRIVERPDRSLSPRVRRSTAISLACWCRSAASFAKHLPVMNSSSIGTPARIEVSGAASS